MTLKRTALIAGSLVYALLVPATGYGQLPATQTVTGQIDQLGRAASEAAADINGRLDEAALAAQREARVAEAVAREAALDPIARALNNPLAQLPNALPILDNAGQLAHIEVIVEDGWRAVAREWLVWLPERQQGELAKLPGIHLLASEPMPGLGLALVRFQVDEALDSRAALAQLLPTAWQASLDRNHIFNSQTEASAAGMRTEAASSAERQSDQPSACTAPVRLGMVDTQVQTEHPAFAQANITGQSFLPAQLTAPSAHGTAVAGLLIGSGEGLQAPLRQAELFVASAFYARSDYSQGATTQSLLRALNWLATEQVRVINLSLAGPPNQLLALAVARLAEQQIAMVAAVGNEGPAAPALYPAAYPQVLAVTAVDQERHIYRWANQGEQVAFAAMGVSVVTARAQTAQQSAAFGRETGTSMAAPIITARLACALANGAALTEAIEGLEQQAIDLGEAGRDSVFGAGLVL
ncbi:S8 family serine peptidase [Simiduia curdlanivorans]|uniref:S8 family serine peptidase n=1 Tax=Simiduia curdlanivorans TaxID=1492769 RepID=A0ABV8V194_9GAMM|nr:S8 family serine peptidase [Simiduia curdlanivorans]MDN3637497.1 S8 family serine peptidase [Simiduia curdlanivorans]